MCGGTERAAVRMISLARVRGKAAKRDALKRDERACRGGFQRGFHGARPDERRRFFSGFVYFSIARRALSTAMLF